MIQTGVIIALIGMIAASLQLGFRPHNCSRAAEVSYTLGYTKGITETLDMKL